MVRSPYKEKLDYWTEKLKNAMKERCAEVGASLEVTYHDAYPGYILPDDHLPMKKFEAACAICGIPLKKEPTLGGSDANIFNNEGLPVIVTSRGSGGAHMKTEYEDISELVKIVKLNLALAVM